MPHSTSRVGALGAHDLKGELDMLEDRAFSTLKPVTVAIGTVFAVDADVENIKFALPKAFNTHVYVYAACHTVTLNDLHLQTSSIQTTRTSTHPYSLITFLDEDACAMARGLEDARSMAYLLSFMGFGFIAGCQLSDTSGMQHRQRVDSRRVHVLADVHDMGDSSAMRVLVKFAVQRLPKDLSRKGSAPRPSRSALRSAPPNEHTLQSIEGRSNTQTGEDSTNDVEIVASGEPQGTYDKRAVFEDPRKLILDSPRRRCAPQLMAEQDDALTLVGNAWTLGDAVVAAMPCADGEGGSRAGDLAMSSTEAGLWLWLCGSRRGRWGIGVESGRAWEMAAPLSPKMAWVACASRLPACTSAPRCSRSGLGLSCAVIVLMLAALLLVFPASWLVQAVMACPCWHRSRAPRHAARAARAGRSGRAIAIPGRRSPRRPPQHLPASDHHSYAPILCYENQLTMRVVSHFRRAAYPRTIVLATAYAAAAVSCAISFDPTSTADVEKPEHSRMYAFPFAHFFYFNCTVASWVHIDGRTVNEMTMTGDRAWYLNDIDIPPVPTD
ncbi:hypothetical protein EVG20_g10385 [Dentipellis fragilis]|uniref:Uncharacterized protein n=1 Tax=Dentipellis fragilis TaxID=205917 RepID=A0A4Y9XRV8_9AGAM|nr:hypothetical protein EVG20_g10385 [Dentipellis fragilis]